MPSLRSAPGGGGVYSADEQLNDLIFSGSDVEPPVDPALVPAGTPAPPTMTNAYPTAGPPGNAFPGTEVGYGEQIPAQAPPQAAPVYNQSAAEPYGTSPFAIHAGGDSNTLRSQEAYSPPPLATVFGGPLVSRAENVPGPRNNALGIPNTLASGLMMDDASRAAADEGVSWDALRDPGSWLPEPNPEGAGGRGEAAFVGGPVVSRAARFTGRRTAPGGAVFAERPGRSVAGAVPETAPPTTPPRRVTGGPGTAPPGTPRNLWQVNQPPAGPPPTSPPPRSPSVVNAQAPGPRTFPPLPGQPGSAAPGGGIWGPRGNVVYPRGSAIPSQPPIAMPAHGGRPPGPAPGTAASAQAAGQAGASALGGPSLAQRVATPLGASRIGPRWGRGRGVATAAAGAAAIGAAGSQLSGDGEDEQPSIFTPGATGLGQRALAGARNRATVSADDIPSRPSLVLQPDGNVALSERTSDAFGAGTGLTDFTVSVVQLNDAGQIVLTDPAMVPQGSLAAALERGEEPWALDEAEMDALIASGLIANADGEPLTDPAEIANWKSLLVGNKIMAPAEWVAFLKAADVTFAPVEQPAAETVVADSGGSSGGGSWNSGYSRRSSGGGGYTRGSGGGGGYGGGSGGGFPGFSPSAMDFLGPDFMDGFMENFRFRDMMGAPAFAAEGGRRSRMRRRRGMPVGSRRARRGARAIASPGKAETIPAMPGGDDEPQKAKATAKRKKKDE